MSEEGNPAGLSGGHWQAEMGVSFLQNPPTPSISFQGKQVKQQVLVRTGPSRLPGRERAVRLIHLWLEATEHINTRFPRLLPGTLGNFPGCL